MSEIPEHYAPALNDKIRISLRGVIGFSQVVIQIMLTSDTELLRSQYAEKEMLERLRKVLPAPKTINSNRTRAARQITGIFRAAGYIEPDLSNLTAIVRFLIDNRIIYPISI